MTLLKYKGYLGTVEVESDNDGLAVVGRVVNLPPKHGISYEASRLEEIQKAFEEAVEDYLEWAAEKGFDPEKPISGKTLLRWASPEEHGLARVAAQREGLSLVEFIRRAVNERAERLIGSPE